MTAIFGQFAVCGSVRGTWLWLRDQGLKMPLQRHGHAAGSDQITWVAPTYHAVHGLLTHRGCAGAYSYGRTGQVRRLSEDGMLTTRRMVLPRDRWRVLIKDHHAGYISWDTCQSNQARIGANIRPMAHQPGTGAVREGCAQLQGVAICGTCGRMLAVYYEGKHKAKPGYYCTGTGHSIDGRGTRHLRTGGMTIDTKLGDDSALPATTLRACGQLT